MEFNGISIEIQSVLYLGKKIQEIASKLLLTFWGGLLNITIHRNPGMAFHAAPRCFRTNRHPQKTACPAAKRYTSISACLLNCRAEPRQGLRRERAPKLWFFPVIQASWWRLGMPQAFKNPPNQSKLHGIHMGNIDDNWPGFLGVPGCPTCCTNEFCKKLTQSSKSWRFRLVLSQQPATLGTLNSLSFTYGSIALEWWSDHFCPVFWPMF